MEGHLHRTVGIVAAVILSLLHNDPATADDMVSNVKTDDAGVTVAKIRQTVIGAVPGRARGDGASECDWKVSHFSNGPIGGTTEYAILGGQPTPDHQAYFVFCGDAFRTVIWRNPNEPGSPPRLIAEELVDHIPVPFSGIGINPTGGITGLESWFWAEGYDGRPITYSDDRLGIQVAVEATPSKVTWDFGDGTPSVAGDFGRAYPARSSVAHVYERSSRDRPYTVRLNVDFAVRYQVDDSDWIVLPGITRTQSRPYSVIQLQAVRAR